MTSLTVFQFPEVEPIAEIIFHRKHRAFTQASRPRTRKQKVNKFPVGQVSGSLGRNRPYIDIAEFLPFALLYTLAAIVCARVIWRRYPPADGWAPGITMVLSVSLAFAVGSIMLGEQWNWFVEGHRIGNNYMSYRADRLFWAKHRFELFAAALMIFWLARSMHHSPRAWNISNDVHRR